MNRTHLGKYTLLEKLGEGGFGIVYKASDPTGRIVAIKILKPAYTEDPTTFQRFRQEAQIAGALFHPHIATILDFDETDGHFYLVMRYVPGKTLTQALDKGAFHWKDAVQVLSDIASALEYAHQKGFIHRDVKPGNIIFNEEDGAVLTDFGLVKAAENSGLSTSGVMLGTPNYIAPEIWEGLQASPATDVYSLACVLYEMLTGQILFTGKSAPEIMTRHILHGPHLPEKWSIGIPDGINDVLTKALEKDVKKRFRTVGEFNQAVNNLSSRPHNLSIQKEQPKAPFTFRQRNALWLVIGGIIGTILCGLLFFALYWSQKNDALALVHMSTPTSVMVLTPAQFSSQIPTLTPLPTASATPSLTLIVVQSITPVETTPPTLIPVSENPLIQLENVNQLTPIREFVGHLDTINKVVFSPNGQWLASASDDDTVIIWDVFKGTSYKILNSHTAEARDVAFFDNGNKLATVSFDQTVILWNAPDGSIFSILKHTNFLNSVAISSDNQMLVTGAFDYTAWIWDLPTRTYLDFLYIRDNYVRAVAISPDSRIIAASSANEIGLWFPGASKPIRRLKDQTKDVYTLAFSPDGQFIVAGGGEQTISVWRVSDGQLLYTFTGHSNVVWSVSFSPDGKLLATGSADQTIQFWDISSGQHMSTLSGLQASIHSVNFSPDGKYLVSAGSDGKIILWGIKP